MTELGGSALSMRMLPLSWTFEPATRMVRDLGRSLSKPVECVTSGAEIELDRHVIDRLSDPLVHILRNCVDHGIELPEARKAAGKPAVGRIQLSARQDGAAVIIEISDDGAGISLERVRAKAIQRGIIDAERASTMSEAQMIDLIFLPGFSTSPIITDLSGRGVGMDVVKKIILDELRGIVTVETREGQGTLFRIKIPVSLSMMRVLVCEAAGVPFGFTAQYITEMMRVRSDQLLTVTGAQAFVLRNEFVHLISLAKLLNLPAVQKPQNDSVLAVVVHAGEGKLGLIVDTLLDERDMVIKPLPQHLGSLTLVSGMVVSNKNQLVSVLHVPKLIEMAKAMRGEAVSLPSSSAPLHSRILVVDDSLNTREIEKEVLESHGFTVFLAEDGIDGWQKAMAGDYDAVLTDVEMPGMDGFALTRKLRGHEKYQHTPIIIITSRDKEDDRRRGIEVGADAYIVKGDFNQSSLVDTLRSLLG
jgi:chemotaxis protein histidine kinase CheA